MITGEKIRPGHVVIGMASSGLHTNGYSLARKVLFTTCGHTVHTRLPSLGGATVGEALLKPHTCYWPAIRAAMAENLALDGLAHLTGGGFYDNIPRVLPEDVDVIVTKGALPILPIFSEIQRGGNIGDEEMHRVFNMGCGMVWMVPPSAADRALAICRESGFEAAVLGEVVPGSCSVKIRGIDL